MLSIQKKVKDLVYPLLNFSCNKYEFGLKNARYGNKVFPSAKAALYDMKSGSSIFFGGFGLCGCQENLIDEIEKLGLKDLTCIANNPGTTDWGVGKLIRNDQVKRMVCTYIGGNKSFGTRYLNGEIEAYILPQGTLGERIKAGSFGYPAFYTRTGVGTMVQEGGWVIKYKKGTTEPEILSESKNSRFFGGREYIREEAMTADFAVLTAKKADTLGNVFYHGTARNLNQDMAPAARTTIVEVEEIVEPGQIKPDDVHTPGIFVDRIVLAKNLEKRIEILSFKQSKNKKQSKSKTVRARERIAKRAAKEMRSGMYANLGIGIPTLIPAFLPENVQIMLHSENGLLGIGDFPKPGEEDPDIVNASKATVTTIPGSSLFPTTVSFGIIRGKHLDMTVMGSMEVAQNGDLANWVIPGKRLNGMGGGMDLVSSGSEVMICMQHMSEGKTKVLKKCTLPLTGSKCVTKLATDLAFFTLKNEKMTLVDLAQGVSLEELRQKTEADFETGEQIGTFD